MPDSQTDPQTPAVDAEREAVLHSGDDMQAIYARVVAHDTSQPIHMQSLQMRAMIWLKATLTTRAERAEAELARLRAEQDETRFVLSELVSACEYVANREGGDLGPYIGPAVAAARCLLTSALSSEPQAAAGERG